MYNFYYMSSLHKCYSMYQEIKWKCKIDGDKSFSVAILF
jgi:hypothetical protein